MVSLIKQGKHALIMMREHYLLNQLEVAVKKKNFLYRVYLQ